MTEPRQRASKPVDPDDDKPYNAADPRQVKKRYNKAQRAADDRAEGLKQLLQQPAFRAWLWHLICARCDVFTSPFNPNGSQQSLNIGRQSIGLELFHEVESIDPRLIILMMSEFAETQS